MRTWHVAKSFLHNLVSKNCNILTHHNPKYNYKAIRIALYIGGENMASRKCDCTKKSATKRTSNKTEASTDNAKTNSRTTSKKTSRTKNCN